MWRTHTTLTHRTKYGRKRAEEVGVLHTQTFHFHAVCLMSYIFIESLITLSVLSRRSDSYRQKKHIYREADV